MDIIYVDDDAANRAVMREMLATAGVEMAEAADAASGLAAIDSGDFDVVLMDLRMPHMNGLTAIRQLRARAGAKGRVPVLVVTADLTAGVKELCKGAGADAFLVLEIDAPVGKHRGRRKATAQSFVPMHLPGLRIGAGRDAAIARSPHALGRRCRFARPASAGSDRVHRQSSANRADTREWCVPLR